MVLFSRYKTTPILVHDASFSTIKVFEKAGNTNTGGAAMFSFNSLNVISAFSFHLKVYFCNKSVRGLASEVKFLTKHL